MAARPMTNAERQEAWRNRHVRSVDGEKERLTLVLEAGTKARLARITAHYGDGSVTRLIERWARQTDGEISDEIERRVKAEIVKESRERP